MKALRRAWKRLAGSFAVEHSEGDMAAEIEAHIAMLTDENRRAGMTQEEARRAALLTFGDVELAKEEYRDQRGWPTLDSMKQDIRYALRGMKRNPVFAGVAIASLALGIGANTACFGLFDTIMMRQLPVNHPENLVFFGYADPGREMAAVRRLSSGHESASLPYATYEAFRKQARSLVGAFVFASAGGLEGNDVTVSVRGRAIATDAEMVTGGYFALLGIRPEAGRTIIDADLEAGAPNVAVISHALWVKEFEGNPSAVGTAITVNGSAFTIVGVAPKEFLGLQRVAPQLWVPLRPTDSLRPWGSRAASPGVMFNDRKWWWCTVGGRLKPGVTRTDVLAETEYLFRQSITEGVARVPPRLPKLVLASTTPATASLRRTLAASLATLMVAAALVLAAACINLATLLVARAKARQREIGVRLAIGGSRRRIIRQLLTESVVMSTLGGVAGLLIAWMGQRWLHELLLGGWRTAPLDSGWSGVVFAFAVVVSMGTGVLFGLAPALHATRTDVAVGLRDGTAASTPKRSLGRFLVAAQAAVSVVLLFGAGLFVRTLSNLERQDLGFRRENLLLFNIDPERSGYKGASGMAVHDRVLERIRAVPGVRAATYSQYSLLSGWCSTGPSATDGAPLPPGRPNEVSYNRVGPDYFDTMGIDVVLGRGISTADSGASRPVAVVNESWAHAYFAGESAIGHRLSMGGDRLNPEKAYEIVGVVSNARFSKIREAPPRTVYLSSAAPWDRARKMTFAVRAIGDPLELAGAMREAVWSVDRRLPIFDIATQTARIEEALSQEIVLAKLATIFGLLALLLVSIGIYGTLSYAVAQRTGEIGIRMALGARATEVEWMILREGFSAAARGIAIGLPAALIVARMTASRLFGVGTFDGTTMAATVAAVGAVTLASSFVPAHRAAGIDPLRALRHE